MARDIGNAHEPDLLPVRQRVAWMAAIWILSVGALALAAVAVRALLT